MEGLRSPWWGLKYRKLGLPTLTREQNKAAHGAGAGRYPARGPAQHSCVCPRPGPTCRRPSRDPGAAPFPTALHTQHLESPLFYSQLPLLSPCCTHSSMHRYLLACGPEPAPCSHTYSDGEASCQSRSCSSTSPLEGAPPSGHLGSLLGLTAPFSLCPSTHLTLLCASNLPSPWAVEPSPPPPALLPRVSDPDACLSEARSPT